MNGFLVLLMVVAVVLAAVAIAAIPAQAETVEDAGVNLADSPDVTFWSWYYGRWQETEWFLGFPTYMIRMGTDGFYYKCTTLLFQYAPGQWENVAVNTEGNGHWRAYNPYGTLVGSKNYHLSVFWLATRWSRGLEPTNYLALCTPY